MYTYKDIEDILSPYFKPVLVDKIMLFEPGQYIYALKNVSLSDAPFSNREIRLASPGALTISESTCQLAYLFGRLSGVECKLDEVHFNQMRPDTFPGDTLCIDLARVNDDNNMYHLNGRVLCDGRLICTSQIRLAVRNRAQ